MTEKRVSDRQKDYDENQKEITSLLKSLRGGVEPQKFDAYIRTLDGFLKGTLALREFLPRSQAILPKHLHATNDEIRSRLCEIGRTDLTKKKYVRRAILGKFYGPRSGNRAERGMLLSEDDLSARLSLHSAIRGFTGVDGECASIIHSAMRSHIQSILLDAMPNRITTDGFIETTQEFPKITVSHIHTALRMQEMDPEKKKTSRELAGKERELIDKIIHRKLKSEGSVKQLPEKNRNPIDKNSTVPKSPSSETRAEKLKEK